MSYGPFRDSLTRASGRWVIIFAASLPAGLAWAQATWTGAANQDWNTASNWSTSPANPSGNVTVNTAAGNYPVVSANPTFTPVDIVVGGGGGTGQLDQTAGTLATGNGNWMFIGSAAGSEGAYNLGGSGSVSADRLLIGDTVGSGGAGVLTMNTSGTLTTTFSNSGQWWQDAGLVLGPGAGSPATLNLQGGTINSTNVWVGAWGSTGTWNQTGGTANVTGVFSVGNYEDVQGLTTGVATVQNGVVNATNVYVGRGRFTVDEISAVLTVSGGGAVNSENDLFVGYAGANNTGTLNINNGGTVSVGSTTERWIGIGRFDTANGQATIASGGTLNLNAGTDLRLGDSTTGTAGLDVNGGSLVGTGAANSDATTINLLSSNSTVTIRNGGLVVTSSIFGNAASSLNVDGGTLRAIESNPGFVNFTGGGTATVLAGGVIIDSAGHDITVVNGLLGDGVSTGGGLTKSGLGTLVLSGTSTYTGATVVNAGTLVVNGALSGTSGLSLATGASVGGTGSIAGNLTFGSGTQLAFDPTTPLTIAGTATFASPSTFGIDDILGVSSSTPAGTYTLIAGTVDTTGLANLGSANAYDLGSGVSAYFQSGSLQMVVVPEPATVTFTGLAAAATAWFARRRLRRKS